MAENEGSRGKWKDIMDKLSSIEDLQNLTQLDVINLKNEIEKIKLVSPSPVPPDIQEKIVELEKIANHVDILKKWKQTVEEVKFLRSKVMKAPPSRDTDETKKIATNEMEEMRKEIEEVKKELRTPRAEGKEMEEMRKEIEEVRSELRTKKLPTPPKPDETEKIEEIRKEIEDVRNELSTKKLPPPTPPIDVINLRKTIEDNRKTIENLKSMISEKPEKGLPNLGAIKKMINENRKLVEDLRTKVQESLSVVPAETHGELETLHNEITKLESEVKRLKEEKPAVVGLKGEPKDEPPKSEIDFLRKEIFAKLEDLNMKFGMKGSEELKNAIDANRMSVEKLKSIIYGKEVDMDGVIKEINKNRRFIEEMKDAVMGKTGKVMLPPEPELRKKMLQVEQRIESLGRKLDKMNRIKPIKIPMLPRPRIPQKMDIEKIKKDVDSVLSRMGDFITKDEIEKGFLEKRLKTDEKLVGEDLDKELDEIKKTIIRNEDYINNIVSDMEEMKKEVGTVEKREWAKVSELPEIEELKKRIDELEKRLESGGERPMFIE